MSQEDGQEDDLVYDPEYLIARARARRFSYTVLMVMSFLVQLGFSWKAQYYESWSFNAVAWGTLSCFGFVGLFFAAFRMARENEEGGFLMRDKDGKLTINPNLQEMMQNLGMDSSEDMLQKMEKLQQYYSPHRGRFTSIWQRDKSKSRTELQLQLTEEMRATLAQGAALEEAILTGKRNIVHFQSFIIEKHAVLMQLQQAAEAGMSPEHLSQARLEQIQSQNRINEKEAEIRYIQIVHQIEMDKLKVAHENEVKREKQKAKIGLKTRATEYDQDQKDMDRIEHVPFIVKDNKRKHLNDLYDERFHLENSRDPEKEHKLAVLDILIKQLEVDIRG